MTEEMEMILTKEEIKSIEAKGIVLDSDLLDPKVDIVFKAMFTLDTEASRKALMHFLSSVLKRKITMVDILNNEIPNTGILQKQSILDVHTRFDNGDEADIEMQMSPKDNLINRSEYNTAKMFGSQDVKGKLYSELKKAYCIMIMNFSLFPDRAMFFDEYTYRNEEGRVLSGNTRIIFIELSKLNEAEKKPVSEMTGIERWALFLKYGNNKKKRDLIGSILKSEEGIQMAAETLETISEDRKAWVRYYHELKAENDRETQLLYARSEGKIEGIEEGIVKGIEQGKEKKAYEAAERALKRGANPEDVAYDLELSLNAVLEIKGKLS